jgi:hypothetical protein
MGVGPIPIVSGANRLPPHPEFDGANADVGLSKVIHKILVENMGDENARFQGDYDIPLQLIAYHEGHRAHVTVYQS